MDTRLFIMSIIMSYSIASATIIDVPADSATIQGGINGSNNGDTVLVQPGTYIENVVFGGHNIVLGSLFLITGDTSHISTTVIDGDSAGLVVIFGNGEDSTAVITGFTIRNGYSNWGGGISCVNSNPVISYNIIEGNIAADDGGGIYTYFSSPLISNNIIRENISFTGGGIYCFYGAPVIFENSIFENVGTASGGGIYCVYSSAEITSNLLIQNSGSSIICSGCSPLISDNTINNNHSDDNGGGIACYSSSPIISENILSYNSALSEGGGIYIDHISSPDIINNDIIYNIADVGAGIRCDYDCNPYINNNNISDNFASSNGGGIYCGNNGYPSITENEIKNNRALQNGGGICVDFSRTLIRYNYIGHNSAKNGAGIFFTGQFAPHLDFNIIDANISDSCGGGICYDDINYHYADNNTIICNVASYGGAVYCIETNSYFYSCIFWFNFATIDSNVIYIGSGSSPLLKYSDVEGGWPGVGNIDCCPEFCSPPIADFHLTSSSCCLGAGYNGVDIGALGVGCDSLTPNCSYVIGDVNGSLDYNGLDITYGVSYLKGGEPPVFECECTSCNIWYASGDVNGSCSCNGLDITYGVSYLKGVHTELFPCPDCPPAY